MSLCRGALTLTIHAFTFCCAAEHFRSVQVTGGAGRCQSLRCRRLSDMTVGIGRSAHVIPKGLNRDWGGNEFNDVSIAGKNGVAQGLTMRGIPAGGLEDH